MKDFIKTPPDLEAEATPEDVKLMKDTVGTTKVKVPGNPGDRGDLPEAMIEARRRENRTSSSFKIPEDLTQLGDNKR